MLVSILVVLKFQDGALENIGFAQVFGVYTRGLVIGRRTLGQTAFRVP